MKIKIHQILRLLFLYLAASAPAFAEPHVYNSGKERNTLIELYTSEGCSSCPPADRWLNGLKDDPRLWNDIIPVAFHVDYWDYIGWKDTFSKPEYSERQRQYKEKELLKTVYTPGFVKNGREWRGWFTNHNLRLDKVNNGGELIVTVNDQTITASYVPTFPTTTPLFLNIAGLGLGLSTEVLAGENRGKSMTHDFVVMTHASYQGELSENTTHWNINAAVTISALPEKSALAFWVTQQDNPTPIQSTGGWFYPSP